MAEVQKITGSRLGEITGHGRKQHQVAMFRARNQHATGTYHSKTRHGSILLDACDKSPLLTITKKDQKI